MTNRVSTTSSGDVEIVCADEGGWTFVTSSRSDGGRDIVTVRISSSAVSAPPVFNVYMRVSGAGARNVWMCDYSVDAYHLWAKAWWNDRSTCRSQLASNVPIAVAFDDNDESRFAVACSEAFNAVNFGLYADERTCELEGRFEFFTQPVMPMREYEVSFLIDRRMRFWADAVRESSDWLATQNGFQAAHVPESTFDPLYSTWYAFWDRPDAKTLEREAVLAAEIGMKTMILDHGWQMDGSSSLFSQTGDWRPGKSRFPDMKAHVAAVHKAGLKYMAWLSVPFVGNESVAWKRFDGKFLTGGAWGTAVLDPRFPEVREYLLSTYERVVGEWGFDGLKLDFIDMFVLPNPDPAVKEDYAGRDIRSLPAAVDKLMRDVVSRLRKVNPEVMIEFRQKYMGPAIRQYGNMMRAADCPADPVANRKRIADLRLTSGPLAVHSDMLVWSRDETPEGAAQPILNALFGTIQYSMILDGLREDHRRVVRHWLDFTQKHRTTLLKSAFRPHHPELSYPIVEAESAAERIVAVYATATVAGLETVSKPTYVINATSCRGILIECGIEAGWRAFDTFGTEVGRGKVGPGISRLPVPASGYAMVVP